MPISSGVHFQRRGVPSASIRLARILRAGVPADDVAQVPPAQPLVSSALPQVTAFSLLQGANLREDISPELYRRIIQEVPGHAILRASILLGSNLREDISPELYRRVLHGVAGNATQPSFLLGANLREDISPELYRRVVASVEGDLVSPSVVQGAITIEPAVGPPEGRIIRIAEKLILSESVTLGSNLREDISPELYRRIVQAVAGDVLRPSSLLLGSNLIADFAEFPLEGRIVSLAQQLLLPSSFAQGPIIEVIGVLPEGRGIIVQAESLQIPSSSLLGANLREDISPELYRRILQEATGFATQAAILRGSIVIELPVTPEVYRQLIHIAEPQMVIGTIQIGQPPIPEVTIVAVPFTKRHIAPFFD